jgi:hypothetical protein
MDIGEERSVAEASTGSTSSTWERQGEASEHWPMRWHRTNGELSSLGRFELLGWDEV